MAGSATQRVPFRGSLGDGGEELLLVDPSGRAADAVDYDDRGPWPVNPDGIRGSMELADPFSDNDRGRSWFESDDFRGTPGRVNAATVRFEASGENLPPEVTLAQTTAGEGQIGSGATVEVTARVVDPDGIDRVTLEVQTVTAGDYIARDDPRYESDWTALAMDYDLSVHRYRAVLPPEPHRTLVRYRIRARDRRGAEILAPRAGDPEPNYAYFVYDGVPDYIAELHSNFGDPGFVHRSLDRVPVYHLLAAAEDVEECQYDTTRITTDNTYHWRGTFVFEERVYDHVGFRLRGKQRFERPKRHWKIRFNKGNRFRGRRNDGAPYPRQRRKLNLNSTQHIGGGSSQGENGLFESLGFRLFRDAGVVASATTWVHFRIVSTASESGQFDGDFEGLFLDIQQPNETLLEEFERPADGAHVIKMERGPQKKSPTARPTSPPTMNSWTGTRTSTRGRGTKRTWRSTATSRSAWPCVSFSTTISAVTTSTTIGTPRPRGGNSSPGISTGPS